MNSSIFERLSLKGVFDWGLNSVLVTFVQLSLYSCFFRDANVVTQSATNFPRGLKIFGKSFIFAISCPNFIKNFSQKPEL